MRFERYGARYEVGQDVVGCRQKMIKMEDSHRNQNPLSHAPYGRVAVREALAVDVWCGPCGRD